MSTVVHSTNCSLVGSGSSFLITPFAIVCAVGRIQVFGWCQVNEGIALRLTKIAGADTRFWRDFGEMGGE